MSCHRLLQRGFAAMYGYSLPPIHGFQMPLQPAESEADLTEYVDAAVHAESAKALRFKMKGASVLTAVNGCEGHIPKLIVYSINNIGQMFDCTHVPSKKYMLHHEISFDFQSSKLLIYLNISSLKAR